MPGFCSSRILEPVAVVTPGLRPCRYRSYTRPRYKVAYKMVTDMEWKCCHGYGGADCQDGPVGGVEGPVAAGRPQPGSGWAGSGGSGGVQSG